MNNISFLKVVVPAVIIGLILGFSLRACLNDEEVKTGLNKEPIISSLASGPQKSDFSIDDVKGRNKERTWRYRDPESGAKLLFKTAPIKDCFLGTYIRTEIRNESEDIAVKIKTIKLSLVDRNGDGVGSTPVRYLYKKIKPGKTLIHTFYFFKGKPALTYALYTDKIVADINISSKTQ